LKWPGDLLTPKRLDLVVKHRFFRHLIDGNDPGAEEVYRWHIMHRTKGFERGSWKGTVDDYVRGARELLASMRERGFDPAYPVEITQEGRIMSGAHRIACALALGLPIYVRIRKPPKNSADWGETWFRRAGMKGEALQRLLRDWKQLQAVAQRA